MNISNMRPRSGVNIKVNRINRNKPIGLADKTRFSGKVHGEGEPSRFIKKLFELAKKVVMSKAFHKVCDVAGKNPPLFSAGLVFVITTTVRPAAILAVPGAKKEDKQYSAARSFATGMIAFSLALMVYRPLESLIRRLGKAALSNSDHPFPFTYGSEEFEKFNYLATQTANVIIAPFQAMLLMEFIPPIVRKIFPNNKSESNQTPNKMISSLLINDDMYKKFTGGLVR